MTLTQLAIADYPDVVRLRIEQSSSAAPSTITADCQADYFTAAGQHQPPQTLLSISDSKLTGQWYLFCVSGPERRLSDGTVRYKFYDARAKLAGVTMPDSYNGRDAEGRIDPNTAKSISQLWSIISATTGLAITVQSAPPFQPPAAWAGKTAAEAVDQLLALTGSRLVYDPVAQVFVVNQAGQGASLNLSQRAFKRNKSIAYTRLVTYSAPTLYESHVACSAVFTDDDGSLIALPDPIAAFLGYPDEGDEARRTRLVQSAFRLWKPASSYRFTGHRAVVVAGTADRPVYSSVDIKSDSGHWMFSGTTHGAPGARAPKWRPEAGIFTTDAPVLVCDNNGAIKTSGVEFAAAYYVPSEASFDGWQRSSQSLELNSGDDVIEKTLVVPQVRPVSSELVDGPGGGEWDALLLAIATANKPLMGGVSQTAEIPGLYNPAGSGRVARVTWFVSLNPGKMWTELILDSPPTANPVVIR